MRRNSNNTPTKVLGVLKNWPDQVAAEHETIERLKHAAKLINLEVVEVDHLGFDPLGVAPSLILSLHFETPKTWKAPSIHPLWNPVTFLKARNYPLAIFNTSSHTFLASGGNP